MAIPDRHADTTTARLDDRPNAPDADAALFELLIVADVAALLKVQQGQVYLHTRSGDRSRAEQRPTSMSGMKSPTAQTVQSGPTVLAQHNRPSRRRHVGTRLGPVKALGRLFATLRPLRGAHGLDGILGRAPVRLLRDGRGVNGQQTS
jgi:hypothetical protein